MPDVERAILDTSCVIDLPAELAELADTVAISTLTVGELSHGLHTADPIEAALRERRYREILQTFAAIPYSTEAAHWYGALAARVRATGGNPHPRRLNLMLASVAAELGAAIITRNPHDFRDVVGVVDVLTPAPATLTSAPDCRE